MIDDKIVSELFEYASLSEDEYGEICTELVYIAGNSGLEFLSKSFQEALENEIKLNLSNFKDNSKIVEKEVSKSYVTKTLEWIY